MQPLYDSLHPRMREAVDILDHLFVGRRDDHGQQRGERGVRVGAPLTRDTWCLHVRGETMVGVYPIWMKNGVPVVQWFAIDIDREGNYDAALQVAQELVWCRQKLGIQIHFERSKGKGIHAWVFVEDPIEAWKARAVARLMLDTCGLKEESFKVPPANDEERKAFPKGRTVETKVFPKQDAIKDGEYGNYLYIPLNGHHARAKKTLFLDPSTWEPYEDQVKFLRNADRVSIDTISDLIAVNNLTPDNVLPLSTKAKTTKKASAEDPAPPATGRAAPGSVEAVTEEEFSVLCRRLRTLRTATKEPSQLSYDGWLAAMTHLVPFANGLELAHRISQGDASRYDAKATEAKFEECKKLYSRPDRAGSASTAQLIIESLRGGGRDDVTPISNKYGVWKGVFVQRTWVQDSQGVWSEKEPVPLANFAARIDCEEFQHDGSDVVRKFVVSGYMQDGTRLEPSEVPSEQWSEHTKWMHKAWGVKPYIHIGKNTSAMVKECLALTAREAPSINTYVHTGWTKFGSEWCYLTKSGPVGLNNPELARNLTEYHVRLPAGLQRFEVPAEASESAIRDAWAFAEKSLYVAPMHITAPTLACVFLAPLASMLPLDFALYYFGHTGSRKSSTIAAFMNFFGTRWHKDSLPGNFLSTWNSIETILHRAKDVPCVIDNFIPDERGGSQSILQRMLQTIGDHAGRSRLNKSCDLIEGRSPRSLAIITGEDRPARHSSCARAYMVEFGLDTVNLTELQQLQELGRAGALVPMMTHYLRFLKVQLETNPEFILSLVERHQSMAREMQYHASLGAEYVHGRSIEQETWFRVGLELAEKAHPNGRWSNDTLYQLATDSLQDHRRKLRQGVIESGLAYRTLSAIVSLVNLGMLRGESPYGTAPQTDPGFWGWTNDTDNEETWRPKSQFAAPLVYVDKLGSGCTHIYIDPDPVMSLVRQHRTAADYIPETTQAISGGLLAAKVLIPGEEGHNTCRITWRGTRKRVWRISYERMLDLLGLTNKEGADNA